MSVTQPVTPTLVNLPKSLQSSVLRSIERLEEAGVDFSGLPSDLTESLVRAFSRSRYVSDSCIRFPDWLARWAKDNSELFSERSESSMRAHLSELLEDIEDEAGLMRQLRVFRRFEMTRIMWRDITGLSSLNQTLSEVSALADVSIEESVVVLQEQLSARYGTPRSTKATGGRPQNLVVIGMGKLGARELNVSSDIDLIFAYPDSGETDHPEKPIDNQTFFTKLGQRLIHVLDQVTEDGFVFRVDMRLRPYGSSGALALNYSAFEDYYQNQGREWERFAMVKARMLSGTAEQRQALQDIVTPFVYRKYTDYSSIQALRDMKRLIMSEIHRKGGEQNIKLGTGGIREVEFIVQACQLIHGGRDVDLQQPGMLPVLELLKHREYLPENWVDDLKDANAYLRDMEHAIQSLDDRQTQLIPDDEIEREQVAWSIGKATWQDALAELDQHREKVNRYFSGFLDEPSGAESSDSEVSSKWATLWQARAEKDEWIAAFEEHGFDQAELCWEAIDSVYQNRLFKAMSPEAANRLDVFFPLLLNVVSEQQQPSLVFRRVMGLVQSILGRTIYLVLLYENPEALGLLCSLCEASPWVAEHLAKSPVILDELLDAHSLYQPPDQNLLQDELRQVLLRIPEDDLEAQMDALRHFKQSHMLRVAAAELSGKLPLMKVSDYLTWLAEALVQRSVSIAWHNMVEKHGLPSGLSGEAGDIGFSVIGYGKMGGIELNYHSDLDMVFLYQCDEIGSTLGERSINNQVFYTRLGQRVIHILSTQTTQGDLYEVDMRLRPSGNSGMLVSSLAAFERYQFKDAWTWEHQALVRARYVAGDAKVAEAFEHIRSAVLRQERKPEDLMVEVRDMRFKMKAAAEDKFKSTQAAIDDIKLGDGGLVDIEFITQYGVLKGASEQEDLLVWSDNVRLLETIHRLKIFGELDVLALIDAYRDLRGAIHRKNLADSDYQVSLADFPKQREVVQQAWCHIFDVC